MRPEHITLGNKTAIIFLVSTKGTKRTLIPLERVELDETTALQALRQLMAGHHPDYTFWDSNRAQFLKIWHGITDHLGLQAFNFKPYSLRPGGATSAYRNGATLDALLTKGRWQSTSTARLYLDTGLQALTQLTLPTSSLPLIRRAHADFLQLSQQGARGRA